MAKKVFVSGCYDLLHSGHVEFFQQASRYGDLYVGIGSDATYLEYKHRKPMFPQEERLFMVKNIKAVKINFRPSSTVRPDIAATRAGQKIDFYDLEALVNKGDGEGGSSGGGSGSGDGGGSDGDQGENPLG